MGAFRDPAQIAPLDPRGVRSSPSPKLAGPDHLTREVESPEIFSS